MGGDSIMAKKKPYEWVAVVLLVIGGLNWGLVGLFNFDLVEAILGSVPVLQKIVYILVGLAAVYMIYYHYVEEKA